MGSGASAVEKVQGADASAITTQVQSLTAADRSVLRAALEADGAGESVATNLKNIAENEARLHDAYLTVMTNKQGIVEARSMIEENRSDIVKNYAAAFVGNSQMANENTDAIMKNRFAILDALKVEGPVQENFLNSKYNEAAIEYLENRSLLNNRVAKANLKMTEANADLIAINVQILKSNEEIVTFNAAQIETNTKLMAGMQPEKATPKANAARTALNREAVAQIKERNDKYNAEMRDKHGMIKANRKSIEENAAKIKERRKEILANRVGLKENGSKVTELLRGAGANVEEVTAKLASLSDEEKENLKAAMALPYESEAVLRPIGTVVSENEAKLHELHLDVMTNKSKLYMIRSIIEENRALVLTNYNGAFIANRTVANQNTDDIFKNRVAILDTMKAEDQLQENFRNSKHNEANVNFLEHRSLLNNRVAKVNVAISAVNAKLVEVNTAVMSSNEEIVKFNSEQIATNKKLLEGILLEKATPEANEARIAENSKRIQVIADRNAKYEKIVEEMLLKALENRSDIEANAEAIAERRDSIMENRVGVHANGKAVATLIRSYAVAIPIAIAIPVASP